MRAIKGKKTPSGFPLVRSGFGMDLSRQEIFWATGLSDGEEPNPLACITQGEWANNWVVPDEDCLDKRAREEKMFT